MKTLADQMTDIEKLDELRRQVRTLKQEAIQVLAAEAYGKEIDTRWTPSTRDGWDPPGDDIEKAQVLRALLLGGDKSRDSESCKALIGYFCPGRRMDRRQARSAQQRRTRFQSCVVPTRCKRWSRRQNGRSPPRRWIAFETSYGS